jgi:pimeloyl-ACP methyl ester carboxylesterase
MDNTGRLIFIHGLEGTSQGEKARLLRGIFPQILTPDFNGQLEMRMQSLRSLLGDEVGWRIIGSSFGGLMAAIFACERPRQVERLILLAPALLWPDFAASPPAPVNVPAIIYHGTQDAILPLQPTRELAQKIFRNLDFRTVDDDHGLYKTIHMIDWKGLVKEQNSSQ